LRESRQIQEEHLGVDINLTTSNEHKKQREHHRNHDKFARLQNHTYQILVPSDCTHLWDILAMHLGVRHAFKHEHEMIHMSEVQQLNV
jgi:hypothetical protein